MDEHKPASSSFLRFGIRDLLWTMVVVGLAMGWLVEYRHNRWQATIVQQASSFVLPYGLSKPKKAKLVVSYGNGVTIETTMPVEE